MKSPAFLVLWLMLLAGLPTAAQVNCKPILAAAERAYGQGRGNLDSALIYLQDAERCDYTNALQAERLDLQQRIFDAIQRQKQQAEADRRKAEAAQQQAEADRKTAEEEKNKARIAQAAAESEKSRAEAALIQVQAEKQRSDSLLIIAEAEKTRAEAERRKAEAALLAVEEATVQIVKTLLRDAQEDIRLFRYEESLINLHSAARLVRGKASGSPLDRIRPEVGRALMEPAYYYAETGQYGLAAPELRLADSLLAGGATSAWTLAPLTGDTLARCREALAALDRTAYAHLRRRYYPDMAPVPGGTFWMGDDETYQVTLDSFQMARTELTFWQYGLYLAATGESIQDHPAVGWGINGDHPVVNVSWYDAVAYLNWLSARSGLQAAYEIREDKVVILSQRNGYRLPTEAEWEFAAGGGLADRDAAGRRRYIYAGSDSLDLAGWYRDNASSRTQPVAGKQPNGLGLHDLSGNVWEWCQDWYGGYPSEAQTNPTGPTQGTHRVLRGGSWLYSYADFCRVVYRFYNFPDGRSSYMGFRPSRTP